jgi:putative two-component system response regulator
MLPHETEPDLQRELAEAHLDSLRTVQRMLNHRQVESAGHLERISGYTAILARGVDADAERLAEASRLHDIGKVCVPDSILRKPGKLAPWERAEMERHTIVGHQILSESSNPLLGAAATIALSHHERWDGAGYPQELAGVDIPLEARIVTVADTFDAMTSDRPYRTAMPVDQALEIMREESRRQLDPDLLDLFVSELPAVTTIHRTFHGL